MSSPAPLSDSVVVLARFVLELEQADDPPAIVRDYQTRYPQLAPRFPELLATREELAREGAPGEGLPARLGGFRLIRQMAHSGMGRVFEAEEEHLKRRVAVKVIQPHLCRPQFRARFVREQRALARLHQTDIIPIFAAGEHGPLQYFVMPFIDGATLHQALEVARQPALWPGGKTPDLSTLARIGRARRAQGPPPVAARDGAAAAPPGLSRDYFASVAAVLAEVADALQHVHEQGIVHRDVKPSNIMICRDGQREKCWVIDFGLAGFLRPAGEGVRGRPAADAAPDEVALSGPLGTPPYMAPEQWTDPAKVDARTDVWGLGATLYHLLTLHPPFTGPSDGQLREQVLSAAPPRPRSRVRGLPADLEAICLKALRKEPEQRYQTAGAFAEDLRRWLRGEPASVGRRRRLRRAGWLVRQNKALAAVLAAAVLAVTGLAVGWGVVEKVRADEARHGRLILESQRFRLTTRTAGWSARAWERARAAARIRADEAVLREAAATLAGLDARPSKKFPHGASSVAWDRDGKRLLMGGLPGQGARLWDRETDRVTESRHAGAGPVTFRGDGAPLQLIRHPEAPGALLLWDVAGQRPVRELRLPTAGETDLTMPPGGAFVAAAVSRPGGQGLVVVWETRSGKVVKKIDRPVSALALSPDGALVAGGAEDGRITLWSVSRDEPLGTLSAGRTKVESLVFGRGPLRRAGDREGEPAWLLAAGCAGGGITIWDLRDRSPRSFCRSSAWDIYALAFSPDGTTLASAGHGGAWVWDVATGQQMLEVPVGDWGTGLAFSADGRRLASCTDNQFKRAMSEVIAFDLEHGRGLRTLRGLDGPIVSARFSPDGRLLAALTQNWRVGVWDVAKGQLLHVVEAPQGSWADNADLAFDARCTRLAFATDKQAKAWDVESGNELGTWPLAAPGLVNRLAFRADGRLLLFRVETRDNLPPFSDVPWKAHPRVCRARLLPDGKPAELLAEIADFNRGVLNAVMPADGSYVVVEGRGGPDGERHAVKVYDPLTGQELGSLRVSPKGPPGTQLVLDPAGKVLAFQPTDDRAGSVLVTMPARERIGTLGQIPRGLGPGAELWWRGHGDGGCSLVRRKDGATLLHFAAGTLSPPGPFNAAGTHCCWGSADGRLTVCDLNEVRRRLADLGLGW